MEPEDITLHDYGPCCQCGSEMETVHVLSMPFTAPVIGTGWGCAVCGLPFDGALVALCDFCVDNFTPHNVDIIAGVVHEGGRIHVSEIDTSQPFNHNMSKHQALDRSNGHVK